MRIIIEDGPGGSSSQTMAQPPMAMAQPPAAEVGQAISGGAAPESLIQTLAARAPEALADATLIGAIDGGAAPQSPMGGIRLAAAPEQAEGISAGAAPTPAG